MKQSLALSIHQRPVRRTASEIMANSRGQRRVSAVLRGLVWLAAFLTAAVILLLVGYILITGIPNLSRDLFAWRFTTENQSMMPALINTCFSLVKGRETK